MTDEAEGRLVQVAVNGAPEATTAQIDRIQSLLAPYLHLFAERDNVTALPDAPDRREAPGRAA